MENAAVDGSCATGPPHINCNMTIAGGSCYERGSIFPSYLQGVIIKKTQYFEGLGSASSCTREYFSFVLCTTTRTLAKM